MQSLILRALYARTIIPRTDQKFQGIVIRGDRFSWNFGPPDQIFAGQNFRDSTSEDETKFWYT